MISWFSSEAAAPGGGLAMLLDGPQGVQVMPEALGVSLLRGPTWPDPSADRGRHLLRMALMPVAKGWSRGGVPQAALAFREPGWFGPASIQAKWSALPALPCQLLPVHVTCGDSRTIKIGVMNPGASRQVWCPGPTWRVGRVNQSDLAEQVELKPGELAELLLENLEHELGEACGDGG
ncbi:MAG: hypothetical protein GY914_03635 [Prochlorococcus sp.]|nr:hypothetical protein [Prochlorococcus sp.]